MKETFSDETINLVNAKHRWSDIPPEIQNAAIKWKKLEIWDKMDFCYWATPYLGVDQSLPYVIRKFHLYLDTSYTIVGDGWERTASTMSEAMAMVGVQTSSPASSRIFLSYLKLVNVDKWDIWVGNDGLWHARLGYGAPVIDAVDALWLKHEVEKHVPKLPKSWYMFRALAKKGITVYMDRDLWVE